MRRHTLSILVSLAAAVISGAIFLVALFRQLALVEVAASVLTGLQVFFLAAAIGDALEKRKEPSRARLSAVVLFAIFLVVFYSATLHLH